MVVTRRHVNLVHLKGHDREEGFKEDIDVMRYSQMEASGNARNLTGYFCGL